MAKKQLPRLAQISPEERQAFWRYCVQTKNAARERSRTKNVPCNIDDHLIDRLLVDQNWRCAVSGIPLKAPRGYRDGYRKDPFGPSLDRITPALGYVDGNVRVVCNIVNSAMSEWGIESLLELLAAMMAPESKPGPKPRSVKKLSRIWRSQGLAGGGTASIGPDSARSAHADKGAPRWYPIECEHGFDCCPICDGPRRDPVTLREASRG